MTEQLVFPLAAVLAIAAASAIGRRVGIASPLLLLALGAVVGYLPFVPSVTISPEWILVGVLPPLLYSAAVNVPAIEFRRDFRPIAGLAVVLVVVTSVIIGLFLWTVVPGLSLPLGIALGAILSPTDAVATTIAKRLGIAPRVVTMLEGESLLNDATALVLLSTALAAIAGGFQFGETVGTFAWSVLVALVVGAVVGWLTLLLRVWVAHPAANTAISLTAPYLAYLPTEHLGGSGLVAAVVAGLVTSQIAPRSLTPEQRMSDLLSWRTIELVLEGAVFLLMGLELREIVRENLASEGGIGRGVWLALAAFAIIVIVRAGYATVMVWGQGRRARRLDRERIENFGDRLDALAADTGPADPAVRGRRLPDDPAQRAKFLERGRSRVVRALADVDYYQGAPLGWRHGAVIVWGGMRGVVTLAAAQTLPDQDERALFIFVAFLVAALSLTLQGFTLPGLVRRLGLASEAAEPPGGSSDELAQELRTAASAALRSGTLTDSQGRPFDAEHTAAVAERFVDRPENDAAFVTRDALELRLAVILAMRLRLEQLTHEGTYGTSVLRHARAELDADQIGVQLRLDEA